MTYLYIVDHYVPFPSSEYGGIWNVIAQTDDECFDLITDDDDSNFYEHHYSRLRENILSARKFALATEETSRIVDSFTT
jgi:hypothetical protein